MKVIETKDKIKLVVVCCLHGDEIFGARVFQHYQEKIHQHSGLRLVLANEEAIDKKARYIDDDLNRNFPGSPGGNHEERLANELLPFITDAELVLDIHTTTSKVKMTPIVANLGRHVRRAINLCDSSEVALMNPNIAGHSLIGNVPAGVSLEFNETYGESREALEEVCSIIDGILKNILSTPKPRRVYQIDGTIPLSTKLPADTVNFRKPKGLKFYPFLIGERAYKSHQGFAARHYETKKI